MLTPPALLQPPPEAPAVVVVTDDGWHLPLHRRAPAKLEPGRPPVLLVHGLLCNHRIWGLPGGPDLAGTLAAAGWDVWTLDLRGSTGSLPPQDEDHAFDFSIDDHIHRDLPAALDQVQRLTGAPKVILGGHSMGGLIALGLAQQPEQARRLQGLLLVAPAIRVGSRAGAGPWSSVMLHEVGTLAALVPRGRRYPAESLAAWAWKDPESPAARVLLWRGRRALWAQGQMDRDQARLLFTQAVGGTSSNVLYQFGRFARTLDTMSYPGRRRSQPSAFHERQGPWSYVAHLGEINLPIRLMAGDADRLVHAGHLQGIYETLGSHDKRLARFPRFGHVDLLVGKDAPTLTFPWIAQALEELAGRKPVHAAPSRTFTTVATPSEPVQPGAPK